MEENMIMEQNMVTFRPLQGTLALSLWESESVSKFNLKDIMMRKLCKNIIVYNVLEKSIGMINFLKKKKIKNIFIQKHRT